ncbi:hypothetical protein BABINDRAFT_39578 [Babjeviella inositovora NRRL Y-12698]|uniref:Nuclear control of ATPase protein 2 n=1 Tax=Babjeviella inositovora NRRL Y-12698 TaxID=984486 RepID=A0A1E3QLN0_9ASCO|nr:uncharacterized protein BABINDRAFT_39578 [Babjeviella inositovora NRRL Y-12698]ODQ78593.1 hypothetical protein BABINDRAFT_39578 [Babjeviella inositovora NRRL Y-12698]
MPTALRQEVDLVCLLEQPIVAYVYLLLYLKASDFLLRSTMPLSDDLNYYDSILSSRMSLGVYFVQHLPQNAFRLLRTIYADFYRNLGVLSFSSPELGAYPPPAWLPEIYHRPFAQLAHWAQTLARSVSEHVRKVNPAYSLLWMNKSFHTFGGTGPRLQRPLNYVRFVLGLPFIAITKQAGEKRGALLRLQETNVRKLGALISELPNFGSIDLREWGVESQIEGEFQERVRNLAATLALPLLVCAKLSTLIRETIPAAKRHTAVVTKHTQQPGFLTRFWPLLAACLLYGPSTTSNLISNHDAIAEWLRLNVVETAIGFWRNWILQPLNNILGTIRHDENSRIAIASQSSLESDLDSLQRMVIDYVVDQNPTVGELEVAELQRLVQQGDLTPFMKDYETQLKTPIKGLLQGKLVRSLLIQVQKTKVDGGMVIGGIDKLLKSQELVFGIVAASPAGFFLLWLLNHVNSYLKRGVVSLNATPHKLLVSYTLNNIQRLLSLSQVEGDVSSRYYIEGRFLIDIIALRKSGLKLVPKFRKNEWMRDLNDLNNPELGVSVRLITVQRIWNVYGCYLK